MIEYIDPFGRQTFIEVLPSLYNNKVSLVIRKERQAIYESLELDAIKFLIKHLQETLKHLEEKNVNK